MTTADVHIERLKLADFRNYAALTLDLDARHVVLTGENGAGKTNLLEAVSFLAPGRGMRRAPFDAVARADADGSWAVNAMVQGIAGEATLGTGLQVNTATGERSRRLQVNGAAARTFEALLEHVRIVWLTPAMDGLFAGSAGDRRRFVDRMVLAVDPGHARRVADYERAVRGRNRLLEEYGRDEWLDAQEAQVAGLAVSVADARRTLVDRLSQSVDAQSDASSPFPDAVLELDGTLERLVRDGAAADLEQEFRAELARTRPRDRAAGRTTLGPHRTDLSVRHAQKSMDARLCSTGEQKALLTGLVLAHARLVGEMSGARPLLLLDEIAAHLDEGRRAALFDRVDAIAGQAWMTGTDASLFAAMGDRAQHLTVKDAMVS